MIRVAMAVLAALAAVHGTKPVDPATTYVYRVLANPASGDEFGFRAAIQQNATGITDRVFNALKGTLGGQQPTVAFGPPAQFGALSDGGTAYATPATNTVTYSPLMTEAITNNNSIYHNAGFNDIPHELAHLRQIAQVLANTQMREGGAQAFADTVTPGVAANLDIPFTPGNYDANYAPYVQYVQSQLGPTWIMQSQFGH